MGTMVAKKKTEKKEDNTYLPATVTLNPAHILELDINKLPDGILKNNMQIVIASEYAGSGEELNEILRAYAKMQIESLSRKNEL